MVAEIFYEVRYKLTKEIINRLKIRSQYNVNDYAKRFRINKR
jgi:hypothetical protein